MVPTLVFPPVMPFTCQVTAVLVVLVTVAMKDCVPPVWTLAVAGVTDTSIGAGGGGGGGVAPLDPSDPLPPHPARCSNPATSPATTPRLSGFPGGSII